MRFGHAEGVGGLRGRDFVLWSVNFTTLVAAIFLVSNFGWGVAGIFVAGVVVVEATVISIVRKRPTQSRSRPGDQKLDE